MKWKRALKHSTLGVIVFLFAWLQISYWTSTNDCGQSIPPDRQLMKAIKFCEYGAPEVLKIEEIEKPVPKDNELLVRVRAASLNFIDGGLVRGPSILRWMSGLRKPKFTGFGRDFAGVVEAIGKDVTEFKPGDEVFGVKWGAIAEYVCARKDRVALKPANITFEQAGAVGLAGLTALQGLRAGKIHSGQKVLINGASGGVGTFAFQIAKAFDTEVTAVCSTRNVEMARNLGADHVIDYTKEDFTKREERYDLVFDDVNNHSISERRRILNPRGICVLAGIGSAGLHEGQLQRIARIFGAAFWSRFIDQKFERYITTSNQADLRFLSYLMAEGKVTPFVEKTYSMAETPEAVRYFAEGHARGKLVINIARAVTSAGELTSAETVHSVDRTREVNH
ncbi:MAG TPA: NAD(P)-dependent alcohol dehydrogenase [Candidatus Udaeobacter sp.]|nr:NAD(P)-dependent alcohol dehydrogenase [Candidatus Udaeobacter sp.]